MNGRGSARGSTTSVDVRTRTAADVRSVDPADFFDVELPALIAERGGLAEAGGRELGLKSFAFDVEGQTWTAALTGDGFAVSRGSDDAKAIVRLDREGLDDIVNDLRTPMGFFTGGDLDMARGRLEDFLDWWVVLRSLLDGRPVHTTGAVQFSDRDGEPLVLDQPFHVDDDPDEIAHFLAQAGYVHIAGVFDEAEMRTVSGEMDAAMPHYTPDDGRSWWARTHDGENRLVRMQYFHQVSPTTSALLQDDRLLRFSRLTGDGHVLGKPGGNENIVEALVKPIGVIEGISDVPWHKDCSLGSHSYRCCSMTVGISVTGADADSGQLRVVAGSHRALIQPAFVRRGLDLPLVDLPTSTGDVTIHLSCTLHMSQPPVTRERRVMYTDFSLPERDGGDPGEAKIKRIREGAPKTVSQPPARRHGTGATWVGGPRR
jgi:Phytanoyl-CoA dioxygenase (PhyH)